MSQFSLSVVMQFRSCVFVRVRYFVTCLGSVLPSSGLFCTNDEYQFVIFESTHDDGRKLPKHVAGSREYYNDYVEKRCTETERINVELNLLNTASRKGVYKRRTCL